MEDTGDFHETVSDPRLWTQRLPRRPFGETTVGVVGYAGQDIRSPLKKANHAWISISMQCSYTSDRIDWARARGARDLRSPASTRSASRDPHRAWRRRQNPPESTNSA